MNPLDLLIFAAGVALLLGGAWATVSGGTRLAAALGVPPVLVGLTVVAWGTSAPELVVSLVAALRGNQDLMLGNVMGSNVANVGLILGSAALVMSPPGDRSLWKLEMPVLAVGTALFWFFCADGDLGRLEGVALMMLFAAVTVRSIRAGLANGSSDHSPAERERGILRGGLTALGGCIGLVAGGQVIVISATRIAEALGAPQVLIGLTLVAVGTSLPELAATLVAAARRESGLALGNVVGSNLFNLLAVTGPVALIEPVPVDGGILGRELPSLAVSTLLLALVLTIRDRIPRILGAALLVLYAATVAWWIL